VIDLLREWLDAEDFEITDGLSAPRKTVRVRGVAASAEEKLTADSF
jgi:hypothetical protein